MSKTPNNLTLDEICKHNQNNEESKKKGLQYQQKPQNFKCKTCIPCKKTMNMQAHPPSIVLETTLETEFIFKTSPIREICPILAISIQKIDIETSQIDLNINPFGSSLIHEIDVVVMLRVFLHQPIWSF